MNSIRGKGLGETYETSPAGLPGRGRQMRLTVGGGFAIALVTVLTYSACAARGQDWKTDHDAGWEAYQAGRLDEAERRLKAAEKEARAG